MTWEYILLIKNKQNIFFHRIALIASWVYNINKGNFLLWCEKKEMIYNKIVAFLQCESLPITLSLSLSLKLLTVQPALLVSTEEEPIYTRLVMVYL